MHSFQTVECIISLLLILHVFVIPFSIPQFSVVHPPPPPLTPPLALRALPGSAHILVKVHSHTVQAGAGLTRLTTGCGCRLWAVGQLHQTSAQSPRNLPFCH